MQQISAKKGFTLIEAVVSVAIGALIIIVLSNMMTGALQMSRSGTGHLTNLLAADLMLQQLLEDLKQARKINSDSASLAKGEIDIDRFYPTPDQAAAVIRNVRYGVADNGKGLIRHEESGQQHRLFADRLVSLSCKAVVVPPENREGMFLELKVSSPPDGKEPHVFKRFVYLNSLPANRAQTSKYADP